MDEEEISLKMECEMDIPSTSCQSYDESENANIANMKLTESQSSLTSDDNSIEPSEENIPLEYTQLGGYYEGGSSTWNEGEGCQDTESISQFLNGPLTFSEYTQKIYAVDDDDEGISSILDESNTKSFSKLDTPKIRKRTKFVRRNLPPALKGLMGEANLKYARGDTDAAIKMCFEVIRHVPTAPEPYQTLAGLYEELGQSDTALQMSLIAAHLSPSDSNQWTHLAEMSYMQGDIKQSVMCYAKAIKADEKNVDLYFKRAELLEKLGLKYVAMKGFTRLLNILDPVREGDKIIEISKMLAEMYHKEKDLVKTRQTLEIVFDKFPSLVTSELINLLLEVLLTMKEYMPCLEILVRFCDVSVEVENSPDGVVVYSCKLPENMAIDLKVKLILTLIHFRSLQPVDDLMQSLKDADISEVGDLYLDVAEAFMMEKFYEHALPLFVSLISSKSYNLPAVWLNYGECLKNCGHIEDAIKAYLHVVGEVPEHNDARLIAGQLLIKLGRIDEALSVFVQDERCDTLDPEILYEKCMLLKDKPECVDQYLATGQLFLSRHLGQVQRFEELKTITNFRGSSVYKRKSAVKDLRIMLGLPAENKTVFRVSNNMPSPEKEWELFMDMCNISLKLKKFDLLQRFAVSSQVSEVLTPFHKDLLTLCLWSCFLNKDARLTFNYARHLVLKDINATRSWNVFNLVVNRGDDARHGKFIMRLLSRNQSHPILSLLHANNCLVSGTYKYALCEYISNYRKEKSPVVAFLIGVTLSQMACQKFSSKKHSLVTQALAFFSKYRDLRGEHLLQECHYNLGRFFHQLGLLPPALHHYKLALKCKPKYSNACDRTYDLSKEAAYNAHLIYLQSGAIDTARSYLEKYVVV